MKPANVSAFASQRPTNGETILKSLGEMKPSSDIDIVVLIEGIENAKRIEKILLRTGLTNYPLDLIVYETADFYKRSRIGGLAFITANDGLLLFKKELKMSPKNSEERIFPKEYSLELLRIASGDLSSAKVLSRFHPFRLV